jgi:alpha-methylacyl-CoA racemase
LSNDTAGAPPPCPPEGALPPCPPKGAPLQGIRVVDMTRLLPGPVATWLLCRLGADVTKVESFAAGDWVRDIPPLVDGANAAYRLLNEGKRHVLLDLKKAEAREAFMALLKHADVLIEQFRPGVMERLGVPPESLRERFPRLIVVSLSGYGQDGPQAPSAGHDLTYLALAGALGVSADDGPGAVPPFQAADAAGGFLAAISVLGAVLKRAHTGEGAHVDVSITEAAMLLGALGLGSGIARELCGAEAPPSVLDGRLACYHVYRCKDGRGLAVAALEPKFWFRFCDALGHPEWLDRQMVPGANLAEVKALLQTRPAAEWAELLADKDCCVELVLLPHEVPGNAQHVARGLFTREGAMRLPAIEGLRERPDTPPGDLRAGADTRTVLRECGLSDGQIDALVASGAASEA